jgi:hypothetical protein
MLHAEHGVKEPSFICHNSPQIGQPRLGLIGYPFQGRFLTFSDMITDDGVLLAIGDNDVRRHSIKMFIFLWAAIWFSVDVDPTYRVTREFVFLDVRFDCIVFLLPDPLGASIERVARVFVILQ